MKITKKLMTGLLLPLVFSAAPAEEDTRDCNFFVRNIQDTIETWNRYFRKDTIELRAADTKFLESYKQFYKKELHEYVTEYHADSADYYIGLLEPGIDTVFSHLSTYYSMLELYGQVCYGVTPETPQENIPDAYRAYIETIQNECRYLTMLILKHCEWGGGDNSLIGNEEKKDPAPNSGMRESVKRLFDEISDAGLSDEEAEYIRSLVSGVKALRKP